MKKTLTSKTYIFDFKGYNNDVIMDILYGVTKEAAIDVEGNKLV